jgi:hypothetical protein
MQDTVAQGQIPSIGHMLGQLADRFVRQFDAGDPRGSLARGGVNVAVFAPPLPLPDKTVYGVWDPVLRRIELHGCLAGRPDGDIVRTLGHEIWHAAAPRPENSSEWLARSFAALWLRKLGPDQVRTCAAALRSQAIGRPEALAVRTPDLQIC